LYDVEPKKRGSLYPKSPELDPRDESVTLILMHTSLVLKQLVAFQ
jgi:hypothetical protein